MMYCWRRGASGGVGAPIPVTIKSDTHLNKNESQLWRRARMADLGARRFSQLIQKAISHPDNVLHYKTCVNISLLNTESSTLRADKIILGRKIQTIRKNRDSSVAVSHTLVFPH